MDTPYKVVRERRANCGCGIHLRSNGETSRLEVDRYMLVHASTTGHTCEVVTVLRVVKQK